MLSKPRSVRSTRAKVAAPFFLLHAAACLATTTYASPIISCLTTTFTSIASAQILQTSPSLTRASLMKATRSRCPRHSAKCAHQSDVSSKGHAAELHVAAIYVLLLRALSHRAWRIEPLSSSGQRFIALPHNQIECAACSGSECWQGLQVWDGTSVLLKLLQSSEATHLTGARVLELGSGTGLAGLFLASLGAHVLLTDVPSVTSLLKRNVAANASETAARPSDTTPAQVEADGAGKWWQGAGSHRPW